MTQKRRSCHQIGISYEGLRPEVRERVMALARGESMPDYELEAGTGKFIGVSGELVEVSKPVLNPKRITEVEDV